MDILIPVAVLGGMGLLFGLLLGIAAKVFKIDKDERIDKIEEVLPGANCGGCGYAGCSAYATAVVKDGAPVNKCTAGGQLVANEVAKIMGVEPATIEKTTARVFCSGAKDKANYKYLYKGIENCFAASRISGGPKECTYGCLGFGSCVAVCEFDAIHVIDGVAVVDENKCTSCGKCTKACPRHLIKIVPVKKTHAVLCSNHDKGILAKNLCKVSCIGCRICEKNCPFGAITVTDNLASIDYDKCKNCGICAEKCPRKIIV